MRRTTPVTRSVLPAVVVAVLALGTVPAHATFVAVGEDPAGDAASLSGGHDLIAVGLGYDRVHGRLVAAFQTREAPIGLDGVVAVIANMRTPTGCDGAPAVGFASVLDDTSATWMRFASETEVTARGTVRKEGYHSRVQSFEVADRQLGGLRPECVTASLVDPSNPQVVYDSVGPLALVPQPGLAARLSGVPERPRAGRTYRLKVKLENPGEAPTGRLRVRLAAARGLVASPRSKSVRSIAAGKRRTATLKVRFTASAGLSTALKVTASAGVLKATASTRAFVRKPGRKRKPTRGGGGGGGGKVCTQFFPDLTGESGGSMGLVPC